MCHETNDMCEKNWYPAKQGDPSRVCMENTDRVLSPSLCIKLGLMIQFISLLDKGGNCSPYLCKDLPVLTTTTKSFVQVKA